MMKKTVKILSETAAVLGMIAPIALTSISNVSAATKDQDTKTVDISELNAKDSLKLKDAKQMVLNYTNLKLSDLDNISNNDIIYAAGVLSKAAKFNPLLRSGLTYKRYYHNHDGFVCYKISQKIPAGTVKNIAKQSRDIGNTANLGSILGSMYNGVLGGLIQLYGFDAHNATAPFRAAAKKGKGLKYSYINHSSISTTLSYNTNDNFTQY